MTTRLAVIVLVTVCAVQAGVPAAMIARREIALREGEAFRFRCAPVDPVDPFRGRYVELGFESEVYDGPLDWRPQHGQVAFARIEVDAGGFARIAEVRAGRPRSGPFVKCRVGRQDGSGRTVLELPFGRYYLNERRAPQAEKLYRESVQARDGKGDTWAEVRVLDGYAVLHELYVGGVPIAKRLGRNAS